MSWQTLPMTFPDGAPERSSAGLAEEILVRVTINGTTFMAVYEIKGGTVLLTSADFGEASAGPNGLAPEAVAARLLREMVEAALARGERFMRDGKTNTPEG